jgi:DNA-directed RNA polymerase specialized sigma24 family protein
MDQDSTDSQELVRRAAAGDQAALAALRERYRARLREMVHLRLDRQLQGRVDPSDVLQEAYLDLADRFPDFARNRSMPTSTARSASRPDSTTRGRRSGASAMRSEAGPGPSLADESRGRICDVGTGRYDDGEI